ncbi:ABC transporter permease [Arthrobacter globiformis]|uniref:ABC transporter permease n=1 Tax=Arthrobacter globiformis TaxID=1665 RepID=UPI002783BBA7|nr:ABC transporter permease [Arthrobacter globiformis]MDQ0865778.1 teichoic acid transport system permease protein [Arthrobacter globiformis]
MSAKTQGKAQQPQPTLVATSVSLRDLDRVGARPAFLDYLVSLWDYRHFVLYDARSRVQTGNEQDRLGRVWLVLGPLLNGLMFYLIMGLLLQSGAGIENFVAFLIIGVFLFQMSVRAITSSSRVIASSKNVIHAFTFPRASLVLAANLRELLSNVPVLITMLILVIVLPPAEEISWRWFMLLPIVALQFIFNLGIGLVLARVVSVFNDASQLISYAMRLWMYGSCMFFSIERFNDMPLVRGIMEYNPLYNVLHLARECLLYGQVGSWRAWAILALWSASALVVGMIFFWRGEETYGREL